MPPDDLTSLKAGFLLENVEYAYRGRRAVAWGKDLPDELFFNYVLRDSVMPRDCGPPHNMVHFFEPKKS